MVRRSTAGWLEEPTLEERKNQEEEDGKEVDSKLVGEGNPGRKSDCMSHQNIKL